MNNCTTLALKIAALSILLLLMTACGSNEKRGTSEFASEQQNLDALLQSANNAEPAQKHPLLVRQPFFGS